MAKQCDLVCFIMNLKLDELLTYVVGFVLLAFYALSVYYYATGLCAFCLMCCWICSCGKWWRKHWSVFL